MKIKKEDKSREVLKPIEKYDQFVLDRSRTSDEFVISYVMTKTEERELYRCEDEDEARRIWNIVYYAYHVGMRGYSPDEIRNPMTKPLKN